MIDAETISSALGGRRSGHGFMARCPAHNDKSPSLSINDGENGKPVVNCLAGCPQKAVIDSLRAKDLWPAHDLELSQQDILAIKETSAKRQSEQVEAAKSAGAILAKASGNPTQHLYAIKKRVPLGRLVKRGPWPQRGWDDALLIPLYDQDGTITTISAINKDGVKDLLKNGRMKGCFHPLGKIRGATGKILIGEGLGTIAAVVHVTGLPGVMAVNAGNLAEVTKAVKKLVAPEAEIIIIADDDRKENGSNPGKTAAIAAAEAVGGKVAIPELGKKADAWDVWNEQGPEVVKQIIEAAAFTACDAVLPSSLAQSPTTQPEDKYNQTVLRLAALTPIAYDLVRKDEANALGCRQSTLDLAVKKARKGNNDNDMLFDEVDPWPEPVDAAQLLTDIAAAIRRFIVCGKEVSHAVALWVAMTWFIDVIQVAPLAVITAPEKRCGKTQLLSLLGKLSARAITASSISPAALFRTIDAWRPTLLIDEADAFMKANEELRGLINSGHTRDSAYVIRTVGDTFTPTKFNTWGAKALAGIDSKHISDTLTDRAILLELRRKLPHEQVDRIRYAEPNLFDDLRAKLARFADDFSDLVRQARPFLPPSLNDRAQDNWEPLLAIAMVAGGGWLEIGTTAALKLSGSENAALTVGAELLADIKETFEIKGGTRISTAELIRALCADDEKPWATYNRGLPIKPRQLSNKLRGYGIVSKTVRLNSIDTAKGYEKCQFDEAFSRYIPSPPAVSVTPSQPNNHAIFSVTDSPSRYPCVTDAKTMEGPLPLTCDVVTDRHPIPASAIIEVEI